MPSTKTPKGVTRTPKALSPRLREYLKLEQQREDVMDALDKSWYSMSLAERKWLDARWDPCA